VRDALVAPAGLGGVFTDRADADSVAQCDRITFEHHSLDVGLMHQRSWVSLGGERHVLDASGEVVDSLAAVTPHERCGRGERAVIPGQHRQAVPAHQAVTPAPAARQCGHQVHATHVVARWWVQCQAVIAKLYFWRLHVTNPRRAVGRSALTGLEQRHAASDDRQPAPATGRCEPLPGGAAQGRVVRSHSRSSPAVQEAPDVAP